MLHNTSISSRLSAPNGAFGIGTGRHSAGSFWGKLNDVTRRKRYALQVPKPPRGPRWILSPRKLFLWGATLVCVVLSRLSSPRAQLTTPSSIVMPAQGAASAAAEHRRLGDEFLASRKFDQAIAEFKKALMIDANLPERRAGWQR